MVFAKYSQIYILFSTHVLHLFCLNIKLITKDTLIHCETLKKKFRTLHSVNLFLHRQLRLLVIRKFLTQKYQIHLRIENKKSLVKRKYEIIHEIMIYFNNTHVENILIKKKTNIF